MTSRKEQLDKVLQLSLSETVAHISLEKFAQCFPNFKKGKVIAGIHAQLTNFFRSACSKEYAKLIEERDLYRKLDLLDECIAKAKARQSSGAVPINVSQKNPEDILLAHFYNYKQLFLQKLEAHLAEVDAEIAQLEQDLAKEKNGTNETIELLQAQLDKLEASITGIRNTPAYEKVGPTIDHVFQQLEKEHTE
ncbi:kinetochore protein Nnf1 [Schizosaccharomyces japonicus yFS275]|uniref:Kinetochore-associated protein n=1 Tax=Schizosaccharomyces japonicus (strain yFS275 / FY16936) TaxID=402676 RepID=B6JVK4_SCHJY|nr:kinetochore protein Nnf1 [Schizosaccharomyces japonicus yFS275]EEB05405.1 kinetochore protein Nnf1 [Schizosaccharomyces japonicus yFS275]